MSNLAASSVEAAGSIDERFKAACAFLEDNPTFLVIDNMDYLPGHDETTILNTVSGRTKILVTTRAKIVKIERFKQYSVKPIEKKDAISLFYRYYFNEDEVITSNNRNKECYVEKIVEAALCNALLVELIAKMAFWEYMDNLEDLWGKLEKDVFGTDSEIDIENPHAYSHKQGELSEGDFKLLEQIRNLYRMSGLDDTRQELMRFIAAFPAESIIFADAFKWAGFKVQDLKYLTERGWIEKVGEGYLIHTMVQGSVILQNNVFDIEKYENLIKELSNTDQYLPKSTVYTKVYERILVPDSVCGFLIEIDSQKQETATLLNNVAVVHQDQGNYKKALEYHKKSLAISEKVLGTEHPDTGTTYNNIALVYQGQGNYKKALEYHKKSLAISEKVLGTEHPDTAKMYNNIAFVYQDQGDYEKALEYHKKSLAIIEKVLGTEHPDTATTYNNIAVVYQDQGNYKKALEYHKKALMIIEKVLGTEHPDTAMTYNNIAAVYQAQGDNEKALEYHKKSLAIIEKVLGTEHPDTVKRYNNIAIVYQAQGDNEKALEYHKKSFAVIEKVLGTEHPDTATTYNNIAVLYQDQGNYEKALEYHKKARMIREKVLGANHPDTATTYINIAAAYQAQGDYEKSKEYSQKAYDIFLKVFGDNHPNVNDQMNWHHVDPLKCLSFDQ